MTSETSTQKQPGETTEEAYVWIWLPGHVDPVVAGRLAQTERGLQFNYGQSYLARPDAIAIYDRELPLKAGILPLLKNLSMPSCLRDASPDAWGRRVIINRLFGGAENASTTSDPSELTFLLESGSDRIGALDFQSSPEQYVPRLGDEATLEELQDAAGYVEKGIPLPDALGRALLHGTSIGGARPKALIQDDDRKYIAKFSSTSDLYNVVKAEFLAMRLAREVGLLVVPVTLTRAAGRDVLLVERFDRQKTQLGWTRRACVSALTLLELDEMMALYASYQKLAEIIRHRFEEPAATLRELFSRLVFNILCGNTDDHARNHAAFWDGQRLRLTPAYDICPQRRGGNEASQAMLITRNSRLSRLTTCVAAASDYLLDEGEARTIIDRQVGIIKSCWDRHCDEAGIPPVDRELLRTRQFLNPFVFEGYGPMS